MIKLKLLQLNQPTFISAMNKLASTEVPLQVAFRLKGSVLKINGELSKYNELRGDLIKKYAEKNEDGSPKADAEGQIKPSEENMQSFLKDMQELLNTEVEMDTVKVSELGSKVELSVNELVALEGMVTE